MGVKIGVWGPPRPGGPPGPGRRPGNSRGPGAGFSGRADPPRKSGKIRGLGTPRARDPLARGSMDPPDPGSEWGSISTPLPALIYTKRGSQTPPGTGGGGGRILGGTRDPPNLRTPGVGRDSGPLRGAEKCTFLRVFNNSPSRDRCLGFLPPPGFGRFLTPDSDPPILPPRSMPYLASGGGYPPPDPRGSHPTSSMEGGIPPDGHTPIRVPTEAHEYSTSPPPLTDWGVDHTLGMLGTLPGQRSSDVEVRRGSGRSAGHDKDASD